MKSTTFPYIILSKILLLPPPKIKLKAIACNK
ncbi:MAG: hypothetical protein ACI9JY_002240 [Saprospiraceae bacterium]